MTFLDQCTKRGVKAVHRLTSLLDSTVKPNALVDLVHRMNEVVPELLLDDLYRSPVCRSQRERIEDATCFLGPHGVEKCSYLNLARCSMKSRGVAVIFELKHPLLPSAGIREVEVRRRR
ncbi:hypothetical protein ANAPC5_01120 [Anaplasma phagocytophilum]|nr:hypothetical protein ANAPC5_01120 [Anaplasma phagocytophilum]